MTKKEILDYLEKNKNERGIQIWERSGMRNMTSFGIGVTKLKTFSKKIGKNHLLALELWDEPIFECKLLATIIDNPKEITPEQINQQIQDVDFWMLSHAYCNNLLPKYPQVENLAKKWITSKNALERRCGFQLYYQIAKNNKKLPDDYFLPIINRIENELQQEENFVKDAMNNALWSIGMRNKSLNEKCIASAKNIGHVQVDYGENSCEAINVVAHLTSERIQKKFKV